MVGGGGPGGRGGHLGRGAGSAGHLARPQGQARQHAPRAPHAPVGVPEAPVDGDLGGEPVGVDVLEHVPLGAARGDLDPVLRGGPLVRRDGGGEDGGHPAPRRFLLLQLSILLHQVYPHFLLGRASLQFAVCHLASS